MEQATRQGVLEILARRCGVAGMPTYEAFGQAIGIMGSTARQPLILGAITVAPKAQDDKRLATRPKSDRLVDRSDIYRPNITRRGLYPK